MKETLEILNSLEEKGCFTRYAIGGAMAASDLEETRTRGEMERVDNLKQQIDDLVKAKADRRKVLARLPWPEKVRITVAMQKMAYPIVKGRSKRACIWKLENKSTHNSAIQSPTNSTPLSRHSERGPKARQRPTAAQKLTAKTTALEYIEVVLRYLTSSVDSSRMGDLKNSVLESIEHGGDIMPTIAEKWVQEGEEKGIEKGIEKERVEVALKLLQKSMSDADIRDITGLSIKKIDSLRKHIKLG